MGSLSDKLFEAESGTLLQERNMSNQQEDVHRFMTQSRQSCPDKIDFRNWPGDLRADLLAEEVAEMQGAWEDLQAARQVDDKDLELRAEAGIIDAIIDVLYVAYGAAVAAGVNLDPFWDLIHTNNMTKCDGTYGPPAFRQDGKLMKPLGFREPDVLGLLKRIKESQRGG